MNLKIDIQVIPHKEQRYNTIGDWYFDRDWHFRFSDLGDFRMTFCCMVHEFVEWGLCQVAGVSFEDVDDFDAQFERAMEVVTKRKVGFMFLQCGCKAYPDSEPGDDPHAPYYRQHQLASGIERLVAAILRVNWTAYDDKMNELYLARREKESQ